MDQGGTKRVMRVGQIWSQCQRPLGFGQSALVITAFPERLSEDRIGLRIGVIERNGPAG